jgi:hypothetical protein
MKTGGFSLLYQVLANVARDAVWGARPPGMGYEDQLERYSSVELLQALDPEVRGSLEVVMGHLPFAVVEVAGFADATIATVVRDPVERVISHVAVSSVSYAELRGLPIEQVYDHEFYRTRLFRNHQTKMLGMTAAQATTPPLRAFGPPLPAVVDALVASGYFDTAQCTLEVLNTPLVWDVPVDELTLARACRNLERVDVLGVHDRYDEFLGRLGRRAGWTMDRRIWTNRGRRVTVPPSFRRRVEEDNALDLELYEHACDLVGRG